LSDQQCPLADRVSYSILGPLEVSVNGKRLALNGRKQRILLAMLACHSNETVATERLIEALWGLKTPRTAEQNLRVYVHQLRKLLGANQRLAWRATGYTLPVGSAELDAERFQALAADGTRALAADRMAEAVEYFDAALDLWRGPALADLLDVEGLRARAIQLDEQRISVREARITAEMALCRHAEVIAELSGLATEYPLREHLQGRLMIALYRSGRRADALAIYRTARRALVGELGIEPGTELRLLHQLILADDARRLAELYPLRPAAQRSAAEYPAAEHLAAGRPAAGRPAAERPAAEHLAAERREVEAHGSGAGEVSAADGIGGTAGVSRLQGIRSELREIRRALSLVDQLLDAAERAE
jgi:DNA-binding SARP family transcriptional activator